MITWFMWFIIPNDDYFIVLFKVWLSLFAMVVDLVMLPLEVMSFIIWMLINRKRSDKK